MLPEKGKTYHKLGSDRTIVDIETVRDVRGVNRQVVFYTKNMSSLVRKIPMDYFIQHYMPEEKPLDKAFKQLDQIFIKDTSCKHTNIRKDHFFSAMVYLTCKDCGKPLN